MKVNSTTIKINTDTKGRLDKLKIHRRESYDDVIQKILGMLNLLKINPFQAKSKLNEIDMIKHRTKPSVNNG